MIFDIEVMWKESLYVVMVCVVMVDVWYVWLLLWLLGEIENEYQFILVGDLIKEWVIIGYNIGYDWVRILEEYSLIQMRNLFLDIMLLYVVVNGMCL